ncbi:MAG: UpxY family transcription antiterminator [Prevotella sp.]
MANGLEKDKKQWYVMRAYKDEKTAEERLSHNTYGLKHFIPKQKVLRTIKGEKIICMVPVIHSLVFVYASHQQIVDFKHHYYYDLQFVTWKTEEGLVYLTVPEKEMNNFIEVCNQTEQEVQFYKIDEINKGKGKIDIAKGKRIRVHGGPFDQVEGYFMKIGRKRGKQLVVIIPDLLAVSAEVSPEYIQVID